MSREEANITSHAQVAPTQHSEIFFAASRLSSRQVFSKCSDVMAEVKPKPRTQRILQKLTEKRSIDWLITFQQMEAKRAGFSKATLRSQSIKIYLCILAHM